MLDGSLAVTAQEVEHLLDTGDWLRLRLRLRVWDLYYKHVGALTS